MSPDRLRAYVLIAMRDILIPLAGLFLAIFPAVTGTFQAWMLPLIAGMLGVPLVARGGPSPQDPRDRFSKADE